MGPVKDADILKTVKENNRTKMMKQLSPEKSFRISKLGVKQDNSVPGGRIRLKLSHVNVNCHEEGTGYTPLIIAVLNGNKDIAEDLIFHSADVNCQDIKGNTPLHMAVFGGKNEFVDLLFHNKAKANIQNSDGNTPLHIVCQTEGEHRVHVVLKLLKNGADPDLLNKAERTSLDVAAMYNKADVVSTLLDHDHGEGKSETRTHTNTLAMIEAAIRGYKDVVEMMLDYGYDPNILDKSKDSTPLIEAVRFLRFPVAETLLKYGAKSDVKNGMMESPESIAKLNLPKVAADKFFTMFEEYKSGATQTPRYLKILTRGASLQAHKDYPSLPNNKNWTQNTPEFCNSCTPNAPNTNILTDMIGKCWIAAEVHHAWTVLDLKYNHTLTGITIYGWDSLQMVKSFQLQRGGSLEGPWSVVMTNSCIRTGNTDVKQGGVPQTFTDFTATSRYWRLELLDNHGGSCICILGIQLYGGDERIRTLLAENSVDKYADDIMAHGYNTYKKFLLIKDEAIKDIVTDEDERKLIIKSTDRDRPKEYHPASLTWHATPVQAGNQDEAIPAFSVKSLPGVKTKVQIVVDPGVSLTGETVAWLQSDSQTEPSIATFSGITFHTAGKHKITIQCIDFPRVSVETPQPLEIKGKAGLRTSVAMAFDDMEAMLADLTASLDPIGE